MADYIQWFATGATILAATVTAANLGARITGYGFAIFLLGSLAWLAVGVMTSQPALTWTNVVLTILNIFGIWRWLGRQSKVEEGALGAAEKSERTAGATLFPLSLLTRAPVTDKYETVGHCVDALAERESGQIRYLVFSEGGVAGVGETLRRIDWPQVDVADEKVQAAIPDGVEALPQVERDHWPAA